MSVHPLAPMDDSPGCAAGVVQGGTVSTHLIRKVVSRGLECKCPSVQSHGCVCPGANALVNDMSRGLNKCVQESVRKKKSVWGMNARHIVGCTDESWTSPMWLHLGIPYSLISGTLPPSSPPHTHTTLLPHIPFLCQYSDSLPNDGLSRIRSASSWLWWLWTPTTSQWLWTAARLWPSCRLPRATSPS